jgi:hypothetical protein
MMRPTIRIALSWAIRAFGKEHVFDTRIRALRVAEEAIELAQASGVAEEQLHRLIGIVYTRPVGDPIQEIGGVLMTTYVLAARLGFDPEEIFLSELLKVLAKPAEHYAKRNQEKLDLGMN